MAETLAAKAHAKVNLVLEVLGKRPDGYHEVDTILQEIELADIVTIEPAVGWSITVSGPRAKGTPADDSNLALRAARLLAERVDGSPVHIHLEKHIPAAGGLGGGASDAATTLRLLQKLWAHPTEDDMREVANRVGSDEAFFLVGGTARAQGRGARLTSLPSLSAHDVVLFVPGQTIERKTPRMFAALAKHPFDEPLLVALFQAQPPRELTMEGTFNAFERVAFDLFPWLATLWEDLEGRTGATIRLCGAGPCMFWIGPEGGAAIAGAAQGADCEVFLTKTVAR